MKRLVIFLIGIICPHQYIIYIETALILVIIAGSQMISK